jgi:hypothetical protein
MVYKDYIFGKNNGVYEVISFPRNFKFSFTPSELTNNPRIKNKFQRLPIPIQRLFLSDIKTTKYK